MSSQARICLCHYVCRGFGNPAKTKSSGQKFQTLEVTDFATIRMKRSRVMSAALLNVFPIAIQADLALGQGGKGALCLEARGPGWIHRLGDHLHRHRYFPPSRYLPTLTAINRR